MSRLVGLHETKEKFPELLPILRVIYGTPSNAWYMGLDDGIESVKSSEGVQQGDVLSMWLYAVAIHPLLQKIRDILGEDGFTKWFADDGYVKAPFYKMIDVVKLIKSEGPKVGYYIKFSKGTYLLGKCLTTEEALMKKEDLTELGLSADTIFLHPDNDPENSSKYGCSVLGSWIGSDEYMKVQTEIKLEKLAKEAEVIKKYPNKQVQHLILMKCFSPKVNHLQRLTPPNLLAYFIRQFDSLKREVFSSILEFRSSDYTWLQACLSTKDGGLGYQDVTKVSYAAYASSVFQSLSTLQEICPQILESNIPMVQSFHEALEENARLSGSHTPLSLEELQKLHADALGKKETLQSAIFELQTPHTVKCFTNTITNTKRLAWFTSLCGEDSKASKWLDATPKSSETKFSSSEFQALLCYRLFLEQPVYVPTSKCYCKRQPLLDPLGHHLSAGCAKDGTLHKTHDSLKLVLKELSSFAGLYTRIEENRAFQEAFPNCNLRPDLSIYNLLPIKVVADISLTHPFPVNSSTNKLSRKAALKSCRAAETALKRKNTKYLPVSTASNLEFLALIFETTGKMHPQTEKFIKSLLSKACESINPKYHPVLQGYWYTRISCSIQKSIADAILTKSRVVNGKLTQYRNLRYQESFLATLPFSV